MNAMGHHSSDNKTIVQHVFDELARSNSQPLLDRLADDFRFVIMGTGSWSRSFEGRAAVLAELFAPLREKIADRITIVPVRLIAEGDLVVVEARGRNTTTEGRAYDNTYCNVIRLEAGQFKEWIEYCDTLLVENVLGPPPKAPSHLAAKGG